MTAVPRGKRFTVTEEPPTEGTLSGAPPSLTKLTGNETGIVPLLEKYSAEYQPPPKANCGRRDLVVTVSLCGVCVIVNVCAATSIVVERADAVDAAKPTEITPVPAPAAPALTNESVART